MNPVLNCGEYIRRFLKIRTKDNRIVPLVLNEPQQRLYDEIKRQSDAGKPVRIIILKARQMGFSTLTEAIIFWKTATGRNIDSMIVAHKEEATANLFKMSKRYLDNLPGPLKPMQKSSNAQELVFDRPTHYRGKLQGLNSRIRCATAGGGGIGRSYTLQCVHLSEMAFWPGDKKDTMAGLLQAVPDLPGTMIIVESTANGYDEFKAMWDSSVQAQQDGTDGFTPIFFAWHEMREYRRPVPPGFRRTEEEQQLAETYHLDDEQLSWRRWCIANNCQNDLNLFHQEYPACPEEAFISTGQCAFDKAALVARLEQVRKLPWERGIFRTEKDLSGRILHYQWQPDPKGPIRIRKKPEELVPYVLSGDTAGTGSDYFAGHVLDNRTGDQVAVIHHQKGERFFAEQMYCLGKFYNEALIAIETNYSTYPEMVVEELGYQRLYIRQYFDSYTKRQAEAFGFDTNTKTRPMMVDMLKDVTTQALDTIWDPETIREMLTFVYDDKWKPQADVGAHDDLVMSLGIAHAARPQQQATMIRRSSPDQLSGWTADMIEDYRNASPEMQARMRQLWGKE